MILGVSAEQEELRASVRRFLADRAPMSRVRELMEAGLNVSFGHDCVMDPWYSMGSGDMLEVAHMAIHVAQMAGIEDKKKIFDAITVNSAKTMGLEGYGLEKGCNADLVILPG